MSAEKWGALGQSNPAATTLTDLYTVPNLRRATVEVYAANQGATATIRISLAPAGAADAAAQYLLYDYSLGAGTDRVSVRFTMAETDVVRVYASTANVSFNANGIEEDAA